MIRKNAVLVTTYNGSDYILEQLESIRTQSLTPDIVRIFDDCSNDNTYEIVLSYIKRNQLSNWTVIQNSKNKGYTQNFLDGLRTLKGYNVFLSDQDDVWNPNKIKEMNSIIIENDSILLLVSGYDIVDDRLSILKHRFSKRGIVTPVDLKSLVNNPIYPGMTFYISEKLIDLLFPLKDEVWIHDLYIATKAAVNNGMYLYQKSLVNYRQHGHNQIGTQLIQSNYNERICNLIKKIKNDELFISVIKESTSSLGDYIQKKYKFDLLRKTNFEEHKLLSIIFSIRNYLTFYSLTNYLADIYYCLIYTRGK